jgi:hypothetical protein
LLLLLLLLFPIRLATIKDGICFRFVCLWNHFFSLLEGTKPKELLCL